MAETIVLEGLIEGTAFAEELHRRGLPPGWWLSERLREGKDRHWICATLHNAEVADYEQLCRAYDADMGTS